MKYLTIFRQLQSPSTRTLPPLQTSHNVSLIELLSITTNLYVIPGSRSIKVSYLLLVLVIVLALPVTMLVDPILTLQETLVGSYGVSITILTVTLLLGVVVVVVVLVVVVVIGVVVDVVVVVGGNSVVVDVVVVVIGVVVDAVVVVVVGGNSVVVVVTVDADKYKVSICIHTSSTMQVKTHQHKLTCTCSTGRSCRWRRIDCYTLE